jgi:hypothetical protein
MINNEILYQNILKEKWGEIIDFLFNHKLDISNDLLLKEAVSTFQKEFFKKINDYPIERKDIEEQIEKLYLIHHNNNMCFIIH